MLQKFADSASDPYLGLTQGEALDISQWSPLAEASRKAKTVYDLLLRCAGNARKDASSVELTLHSDGERAEFQVHRFNEPSFQPSQADAFWIGILVSILKKATGEHWKPREVIAFVCDSRALPKNYEHVRISEHDASGPKLKFPSEWLMAEFAMDQATTDSQLPKQTVAQNFVDSLRQTLRPYIGDPQLNADLAARLCDTSKRTLQLRLQICNTTIKYEIDELRRQQAVDDLQNSDLSISSIAVRAGYKNAASFTRAFRKWTDLSPREYRQRNLQ